MGVERENLMKWTIDHFTLIPKLEPVLWGSFMFQNHAINAYVSSSFQCYKLWNLDEMFSYASLLSLVLAKFSTECTFKELVFCR